MSRDKEFRRPKDAVRQPAGKTETDVRTGEMRGQDFDLRRARDAPVQEDNRHRGWNLYQGASEDGAVPATDSNTYAAASRQPVDEMAAYESADYGTHAEAFPGSRPGILTASFRTAAAFRSKTGRIFPGVTASAKAGSRIPGTVIPAGSSAGMQTFPGAAARSCPVPAVRRLPLLRRPAAQMPGNIGQTPDAPAWQQVPAAFPGGGKSRGTPGETAGFSRGRTETAFQAGIYR